MTTSLHHKEEKVIYNYFSFDILFEISKFIEKIEDFLNFAATNKSIYENLILYNNQLALNEIFKHNKITILSNKKYPKYLFTIENLFMSNSSRIVSNLEIIKKFKNLKRLSIGYGSDSLYEYQCSEKTLKTFLNLEELYISGGSLNESFLELKKLKILHISSNARVRDESLKELVNLTELKIHHCKQITGNCFQSLKKLKKIDFTSSRMIQDKYLTNLDNLTDLTLYSGYNITGECLQTLQNLMYLNINYCYDVHDNFLKNLKKLKKLDITNCRNVTGECLQYLPKLEELNVSGEHIKSEYLNYLQNCNKLYLYAPGELLTEETLQQFTHLISLNICGSKNYKCKFLPHLTNLTELNAYGILNLKDEHLLNLKKLKKLDISRCENIFGNCLLQLTNLESLDINGTKITDEYLENLTRLKSIGFGVDSKYLKTGKFFFNNEQLTRFTYWIGYHGHGSDLRHIKEIRNLLRNGLNLEEACRQLK
ncbi:hypothetical protein ABK040_003693 [Willaertia magna]